MFLPKLSIDDQDSRSSGFVLTLLMRLDSSELHDGLADFGMCFIIPLSIRGCETSGLVGEIYGVCVVLGFDDIVIGSPVETAEEHTLVGA
jgi:hypothetical protein